MDSDEEVAEWIEAFDQVVEDEGTNRGCELIEALIEHARASGVEVPIQLNTPYINTIPVEEEVPYPGDRQLERRLKSLTRWNAMAMVHRQNKKDPGIGGHISTYSSLATLLEVGFNHFFHARYGDQPGDFVYFQGHASPGVYARAYLLGRITEEQVQNFRHELRGLPALSSYPHPWLMPDFWRFPTVSMGLGPLNAIYQARFMRYLENRHLIPVTPRKVWAFVGDGETDEPESMGSLTLASREKLDNLIFVVNCNLQRLDGPVRGNGKIIQELEAAFRGAGWNVIKVMWGCDWDRLFARDKSGLLVKRLGEVVDGEYQTYKVKGGAYIRREFFGKYPELLEMVSDMSDEELHRLTRGGHDPQKVYNAYKRAVEHQGSPTVILAHTVKGYGLGSAEARNATHQEKKLADQALTAFRSRFDIPVPEMAAKEGRLYRPPDDSPEIVYAKKRREELGGFLLVREVPQLDFQAPPLNRIRRFAGRIEGPRRLHHHGLRQHAAATDERSEDRQADRPHHSRRGTHLRHGIHHSPGGHLRQPGTALQAARSGHAPLLPRGEGRADPGRRHHRGRLHGVRSRRPERPTPTTECRRFRSSPITRCSASSASATWSGLSPILAARAS